eukprot:scpid98132/ scgid20613/ 
MPHKCITLFVQRNSLINCLETCSDSKEMPIIDINFCNFLNWYHGKRSSALMARAKPGDGDFDDRPAALSSSLRSSTLLRRSSPETWAKGPPTPPHTECVKEDVMDDRLRAVRPLQSVEAVRTILHVALNLGHKASSALGSLLLVLVASRENHILRLTAA